MKLTTTLGVAALATGLAVAANADWVRGAGLDLWNLPALMDARQAQDQRAMELSGTEAALRQRIRASDTVIELLIEGQISLAEAVADLERINRDRAEFYDVLSSQYPGVTGERELLVRFAVFKVGLRLRGDPARLEAVTARLAAERRAEEERTGDGATVH